MNPEWYAQHGVPVLPCPRCGSTDLYGSDSDDSGHIIMCLGCKLDHCGAFAEHTVKEWNAGTIRPFMSPDRPIYLKR